ncbi:hypothetical protein ISN34_17455 [Xanthomonas translucens pv. translucens]|nr:hypothetical protein ISN30_17800 [Xanthomonas translucens pv. translucens]UKE57388.1 hypothetical protein KFS86_15110 [Xanthomonas translucens pv. hordei]QSQ34159.1 hypothetical protein ISN31_00310 [Xanthomonas translucens pv. translucens]QSQ38423.1 hypothetical protein ISN32_02700 [Xanthomonas translucens pv. translucens]QSQ44948.1 hypothetical protein ISN34_17455 [Xanthomonas translucens pv. translucens]
MRRLAVVIAAMFVASSAATAEKTTRMPDAALSTAATLREQALPTTPVGRWSNR